MEESKLNSEKICKICGGKVSRIVIRYGQYGRKVSWNVKWYGKYGGKVSWIVIRYGQYGKKVGWNVKW
jgi:hypothetical protein